MKLLRATKFASIAYLAAAMSLSVVAQTVPDAPVAIPSVVTPPLDMLANQSGRAFPYVRLWGSDTLTYVGMFGPDAVFYSTSKLTEATGYSPGEGIAPASIEAPAIAHVGAPRSMLLTNERVVDSFEPPAHAQAKARAPASMTRLRNRCITYVYGRPSVMHAPRNIAADSQHRLIITDPEAGAVHVLDPAGRTSFRIVTGKGRRLQQPAGTAVDAADNIYIADSERGMVVVFDSRGNFLRYIGNYRGESEYESPGGIAIDRKAGRLFLIDTPRNLIFVLDLSGRMVARFGKYHDGSGVGEFVDPTEIAVSHDRIYVLDNAWDPRPGVGLNGSSPEELRSPSWSRSCSQPRKWTGDRSTGEYLHQLIRRSPDSCLRPEWPSAGIFRSAGTKSRRVRRARGNVHRFRQQTVRCRLRQRTRATLPTPTAAIAQAGDILTLEHYRFIFPPSCSTLS